MWAQWREIEPTRWACSTGNERAAWVSQSIVFFQWTNKVFVNHLWLKCLTCWSVISLRWCCVITVQILRILLQLGESFIAHPWCLQPIVGLECHWGWSAATAWWGQGQLLGLSVKWTWRDLAQGWGAVSYSSLSITQMKMYKAEYFHYVTISPWWSWISAFLSN